MNRNQTYLVPSNKYVADLIETKLFKEASGLVPFERRVIYIPNPRYQIDVHSISAVAKLYKAEVLGVAAVNSAKRVLISFENFFEEIPDDEKVECLFHLPLFKRLKF